MIQIIQNNSIFSAVDMTASNNKLPVGNYLLQYSNNEGFYLTKTTIISFLKYG